MFRVLICLCLVSSFLFGQNQKHYEDSLLQILKVSKEDTNKVDVLLALSEIDWGDTIRSLPYVNTAYSLSKKIKYYPGLVRSLILYANIFNEIGQYDRSEDYINKAEKVCNEYDLATRLRIKVKLTSGNILVLKGKYKEAIKLYTDALAQAEAVHDIRGIITILTNLSIAYRETEQYGLALKYSLKCLNVETQIKDKALLADVYSTIGSAYGDMAIDDTSLIYYYKALKLRLELNNKQVIATSYNNIGISYFNQNDLSNAILYCTKANEIWEETKNLHGLANSYIILGNIYIDKKELNKAIPILKRGLECAKKIGMLLHIQDYYYYLSKAQYANKNFGEAYESLTNYTKTRDSIVNSDSRKQIIEMQTKYETEKKERENIELKRKTEVQELIISNESQKRKNQLTVGLSLIGFLGISSLFIYNRKKQKQKALHLAELAEIEKLRFKDVIEAEEKERSRIAQELHDGLGQLLSTARLNVAGLEDSVSPEDKKGLNRSLKIIDDACVEVRSISHNMMPSALIRLGLIPAINELVNNINLAKGIKIDFITNVEDSFGKSLDITIYRVVQEILNNMIRHAKANHINMSIEKNGEHLKITMQDNGIGFNPEELKNSKGIGWKNIFSRVSMLDGDIKLESELQKGTMVFINLKLKHG